MQRKRFIWFAKVRFFSVKLSWANWLLTTKAKLVMVMNSSIFVILSFKVFTTLNVLVDSCLVRLLERQQRHQERWRRAVEQPLPSPSWDTPEYVKIGFAKEKNIWCTDVEGKVFQLCLCIVKITLLCMVLLSFASSGVEADHTGLKIVTWV